MAFNIDTSPDALAKIIRDGIGANLEARIKEELMAQVDSMVSKLARDLAAQTKLNVQSYYSAISEKNAFGPEVRVLLSFNNEQVTYEDPRASGGRQQGHGTPSKD